MIWDGILKLETVMRFFQEMSRGVNRAPKHVTGHWTTSRGSFLKRLPLTGDRDDMGIPWDDTCLL